MKRMRIRKISESERQNIANQIKGDGPDSVLSAYLGLDDTDGMTVDFARALELVPKEIHLLLGRNEQGDQYWCDIGHKPQVQGWGIKPAAAVAAAAFLYYTHPIVKDDERPEHARPCDSLH